MTTRTELIALLRHCWVNKKERLEIADMLEADGKYDQQAMELCEVCGWKAKMDGEPCLVCELPKTGKLREAARLALDALEKLWLLGDEAGSIANPAIAALKEVL